MATMNKSLRHLLICCLLATGYCVLLYSYPPGWSDDILINEDTTINHQVPDIDTDKWNNVWISWNWATWTEGEIYYSKRDSLGNCLIPETTVSNNASKSWLARIAIERSCDHSDNDNAQFIWRDESSQGFGIWHAKLANDGTPIVPSHLAVSGAGGGGSLLPAMVLDKYRNINIAWDEHPLGYNQTNYTKLDSLGNPIIEKIRVSPENLDTYWPGIGTDSFANNHLSYRCDTTGDPNRLAYSKLDRDGNILISNQILDYGSSPTLIADKSQNIHIIYDDWTGPGTRVEYMKLDQNGSVLIGPKIISPATIENNYYVHMAMDSLQYLHVVWMASESQLLQVVMYAKLDTMGDYVIQPMRIVHPPYTNGAGQPRIAVDCSNRLHVTWLDNRLGSTFSNFFYKRGENEPGIEETTRLNPVDFYNIHVSPNPFSKTTTISIYKEQSAEGIELRIYDTTGRLVRSFPVINSCNPNKSVVSVYWNGTDKSGYHLPSGIYFLRLETTTSTAIEKMIKLE